jgi:hypothetical protein
MSILLVLIAFVPARGANLEEEGADVKTESYDIHDLLWPGGLGDETIVSDKTRGGLVEEIIDLICETVDPDSWKQKGGANTVRVEDARLIVNADRETHTQIQNLFEQLRETTIVQGVRIDCDFLLVDDAFVQRHAAALLRKKEEGGVARSVTPVRARAIADAARKIPGAIVTPMPRMPLYHWDTTATVGKQRAVKLAYLSSGKAGKTEVDRLEGSELSIKGVTDGTYVTLDLLGRSVGYDATAKDDTIDEIEGLVHRTFAVPAEGAFVIGTPLVRSRLKGVAETTGSDGVARREVVRDRDSVVKESSRYLVVVGIMHEMSLEEIIQIVGVRAAGLIQSNRKDAQERIDQLADGPPPPPRPGEPARAPVKIQPDLVTSSWVFDIRGLLLGPEPSERGLYIAARAKRLERVMKQIREIVADQNIPLREQYGHLIITAKRPVLRKVAKTLREMAAQIVLEPE